MKKGMILFFLLGTMVLAKAQKDSSTCKRPRLFSVQVDLGIPPSLSAQSMNLDEYRKIAPNNELLYRDYSQYKYSGYYLFYSGFQGMPGIRVFADLGGKKIKKEIYFGLRFNRENVAGLNYSRDNDDTLGTYVDYSRNKTLLHLRRTHENYNFGINAKRLTIPLGINLTTNKNKFFWFSMGLEVAPAISFDYEFVSWQQFYYEDKIVEPGQGFGYDEGFVNYSSMNSAQQVSSTKLSGTSFGLYLSAPVAVYMHPFKRVKILKNLHPTVGLTPGFGWAKYKYARMGTAFNMAASAGLRYTW